MIRANSVDISWIDNVVAVTAGVQVSDGSCTYEYEAVDRLSKGNTRNWIYGSGIKFELLDHVAINWSASESLLATL